MGKMTKGHLEACEFEKVAVSPRQFDSISFHWSCCRLSPVLSQVSFPILLSLSHTHISHNKPPFYHKLK